MQKKFEMFSEQFGEKFNNSTFPEHTSSFRAKTKKLFNSLRRRFDSPKRNKTIFIGFALLAVLFGSVFITRSLFTKVDSDERVTAPKAYAQQQVNEKFEFPLKDDNDEEVAKITYLLQSASLQDSFIYQGKVASAVKGRTFLIFDIKITNPYTQTIEVNAKDYIRVKINGSDEQLAPEIHNDPVQIQANSTKFTRIGLPINDTDKEIILLVGELEGDKETVKLNLSR